MSAYSKMETIEHFANISLVARQLGREHLLSREEAERLQQRRGTYGIAAPAPLCPPPSANAGGAPLGGGGGAAPRRELRGPRGSRAPAPICPTPSEDAGAGEAIDPTCQVIVAPSSPGERLLPPTRRGGGPPVG